MPGALWTDGNYKLTENGMIYGGKKYVNVGSYLVYISSKGYRNEPYVDLVQFRRIVKQVSKAYGVKVTITERKQ